MPDLVNAEKEKPATLHSIDEAFFTDKELRARWRCSQMKIWRMRRRGQLKTIKVGGTGRNLTSASEVKGAEVQAGETARDEADTPETA
jgi:hypothetical protein